MTKHERELEGAQYTLNYLPKKIRATKSRGREVRKAQKAYRKAQAKVEFALIACRALPKAWQGYQPKKTARGNTYSRQEVTNLHAAIARRKWKAEGLESAKESYANRFVDRQAYRKELRALPDQIESLKSLIEIADKRRKPKKEPDKTAKWIEVAPGYVVEKHRIVSYCRTLPQEPKKHVAGEFYVIAHNAGYAKFRLTPVSCLKEFQERRMSC